MRRDQGVNGILDGIRLAGWTLGMLQHLLEHLAKLGALLRIGSPREKGWTGRGLAKLIFQSLLVPRKSVTLQKVMLIEGRDESFHLLAEEELPVAADIRSLDVQDGVLAIEVAEDLHGRGGDEEDRLGVVSRVSQAEDLSPVRLRRKRLDRPELRVLHYPLG